jgi:hypothetical protein
VGAFAPRRSDKEILDDFEDIPFLSLLLPESKPKTTTEKSGDQNRHQESHDKGSGQNTRQESHDKGSGQNTCQESHDKGAGQNTLEGKTPEQAVSPADSNSSNASAPEDFVMVELVILTLADL